MRALFPESSGGTWSFTELNARRPVPGAHEVLIRLHAASLHPASRQSGNSQLPTAVAGTIADTGPAATRFRPGDEVFGLIINRAGGGYAEYALARETELALKPRELGYEAAAVTAAAGLTAWQALAAARVSGRDRVLVHDGTGGTGCFAVQLAKLRGATVIATIRSDADLDAAWGLGADQAINSSEQDFAAILGQSIDAVIETTSGRVPDSSYAVLAPGGRLVSTAGPPDAVRAARLGIQAACIIPAADALQLSELARLIAARKLMAPPGPVFPLSGEGLRSAYELQASGKARGNIAITISQQEPEL
ncbi:NADP-dependent oxidoreductase [Paenibacillus piscarius]|uniref:NADP-dependent oxidoreductase n=1 Tax=Paenibacillus piscarius TaxID=1089681 RepID=UPI001EE7824E|nr:NADP-dependent oxidoreductase [Paenibacillus piscarius]